MVDKFSILILIMTYYSNHKDRILAKQKLYYQANKDKIKEYNRLYYLRNKPRIRKRQDERKNRLKKRKPIRKPVKRPKTIKTVKKNIEELKVVKTVKPIEKEKIRGGLFRCQYCNSEVKTKYSLDRHQKHHCRVLRAKNMTTQRIQKKKVLVSSIKYKSRKIPKEYFIINLY